MTVKQRIGTLGDDQYGDLSFKGSPDGGLLSGRRNNGDFMLSARVDNQSGEMQEQLKTKEEEIKILWNVIKEINKSKGSDKVSMEQLQQVISSSKLAT